MGTHSLRSWSNSNRTLVPLAFTILAMTVLSSSPAAADGSDKDRLQVHGFLTQAIATANFSDLGPTLTEIVLGIPDDDLTTDYRFLALQFRYAVSDRDIVIVQLSSRSRGDSPIDLAEDEIELDWAFYERRLADNTAVKVGRIQIPLGIFNEIRDVGTILPFYRPSFVFYREGTFTSETVDGILFSHTFGVEGDWSLSLDAYYGEYELFELQPFNPGGAPTIATAEDVTGIQLWLNTPISGLRLGLGGQQRDVSGGSDGIVRPLGAKTPFDDWYASLEYLGGGWQVRAEYRDLSAPFGSPAIGFFADATNITYYGQVGYFFTEKFGAFVQFESSEVELVSSSFTQNANQTEVEDLGISLNYRFSPTVVLKAEYHDLTQEVQGFLPFFPPSGGFLLDPFVLDSPGGSYSILTFAVSF